MSIEGLLNTLNNDTYAFYKQSVREVLSEKDRDWLEKELCQYLVKEKFGEVLKPDRKQKHKVTHESIEHRRQRLERVKPLALTPRKLEDLTLEFGSLTRKRPTTQSYLLRPEHKGLKVITPEQRAPKGEALLTRVKDVLFAILYCNQEQNFYFKQTCRDYLTITLDSRKIHCLEHFMLAVTEFPARGIWYDPEGISDDEDATNTVMQVEFGDDKKGTRARVLMEAAKVINNLEINEEILYCRIEQAQFSSQA